MNKNSEQPVKRKPYIFILICLICLLFILYVRYSSYQSHTARIEAQNQLKAVAEVKIHQITNWYNDLEADAKNISENPLFVEGFESWLRNNGNIILKAKLEKMLLLINYDSIYRNIIICDTTGRLLIGSDSGHQQVDAILRGYIRSAVKGKKLLFTDLYFTQSESSINFDFIAPVKDENNNVIAVIIFNVDPNKYFYPLIEKWPTPSKTSETIIVKRDQGSALYLNELKRQKNTALRFRVPLSNKNSPSVQAALGYKGFFEGENYVAKDVLAYIEPVPGTHWIMVAKIDKSEIYANLYLREKVIISFTLILVSLIILGFVLFFQSKKKKIFHDLYVKEKELREYHEEYKTILYSIGDGVITADSKGNVNKMNAIAEKLTGWNMSEADGRPIEEIFRIINEYTRQDVANPVHKVLEEGVIMGLANHTLLISKKGDEIPIADSGAPIKNEEGEVTGVILVFRDQSEERFASRILQTRLALVEYASSHSREEILQKVIDEVCYLTGSKIGFFHFVEDDQFTISLQAWSTQTIEKFCNAEGEALHYKINEAGVWADCVYTKKPVVHNDYASIPDKKGMPEGHAKIVRELIVPILRNQKVVAILGIGNKPFDYSERDVETVSFLSDVAWEVISKKEIEEIVFENEARLSRAELISRSGNWELHFTSKKIIASEGAQKIYGINLREMDYEMVKSLPLEEYRSQLDVSLKKLIEESEPYDIEFKIKTKDTGEIKDIHSIAYYDKDKATLFGVMQDITLRKQAETNLVGLNNQLKELNVAKDKLFSIIAHDLKSPFNGILGFSELLFENIERYSIVKTKMFINDISFSTRKALILLDNLLTWANSQTGQLKFKPEEISLNPIIEEILDIEGSIAKIKKITLNNHPSNDIKIYGDQNMIKTILRNLVTNAIKFTPVGGLIEIIAKSEAAVTQITVKDYGIGMNEETQNKIFRIDSNLVSVGTLNEKGSGLGLIICKELVEKHKGRIWVESEPGNGSEFKFTLPNKN